MIIKPLSNDFILIIALFLIHIKINSFLEIFGSKMELLKILENLIFQKIRKLLIVLEK